jgi:hypothetical protein
MTTRRSPAAHTAGPMRGPEFCFGIADCIQQQSNQPAS